jgi:hypothetical protein
MLKAQRFDGSAEGLSAVQRATITATEVMFRVIGDRNRARWLSPEQELRVEEALQVLLPLCADWRDPPPLGVGACPICPDCGRRETCCCFVPPGEITGCASAAEKLRLPSPEGEVFCCVRCGSPAALAGLDDGRCTKCAFEVRQLAIPGA